MLRPILILLAGCALAACDQPVGGSTASSGAASRSLASGPARAAANDAEANCVSEVIARTGIPTVAVLGSQASQTGTSVLLEVPSASTTWSCTTSADGFVELAEPTGA